MQENSNDSTFFQCVKLLIDTNIEMMKKSLPQYQLSSKSDLEIVIFTCAQLMKLHASKNNQLELKDKLKDIISWFFAEQVLFLPADYFEKRLTEYKSDLEHCSPENLVMPLYSFYSIVKSPLRQFEIEKVTDYDTVELYKFKLLIFHLEDMNSKAADFMFNLLK
jgi:hypothetical protein